MSNTKPSEHLVQRLQDCLDPKTRVYTPRYTLLLGAGASKNSGVVLANEMVADFRKRYARIHKTVLVEEAWYDEGTLYSELFERIFDEPASRRDHVENLVRFATPSWGYFYLADLISANLFNAIFTTNFDDLIADACHSFTEDVRPIVCSHDSNIESVRITSSRPKIIKLHGDFLYDNIKNTVPELVSLEKNMKQKFGQYANEYGLIVIGYSGSDQSVMDSIEEHVRKRAFPYGVYWCVLPGEHPGPRLRNLLRYKGVYAVEVEGFDEFMAQVHQRTRTVHPMIQNPYRVYGVKMLSMLNNLPVSEIHPRIQQQANDLATNIRDPDKRSSFPEPFVVNAYSAWKAGRIAEARRSVLEQFVHSGTFFAGAWRALELAVEIEIADPEPKFEQELIQNLNLEPFKYNDGLLTQLALKLIGVKRLEFAKQVLSACSEQGDNFEINLAQIEYRQGELSQQRRDVLRRISNNGGLAQRFCAFILLKQSKKAVDLVQAYSSGGYLHDGTPVKSIADWPITELLSQTHASRFARLC